MTFVQVKQALGSWRLRLRPNTPRALLDQLDFLGHVAIVPGFLDVRTVGDGILPQARFVGVCRTRDAAVDNEISGSGMEYWLGDEDGKGDVFETAVDLSAVTFVAAVTALLPPSGAVTAGTISAIAGTYTGRHQWTTSRKAIQYVTEMFAAEYRVNGNGTLDAGTPAQLGYAITPRAILIRSRPTTDLALSGISGRMALGRDVADYSTRAVLLAEGEGEAIAVGEADGPATPYTDIHGNPAVITRLGSESGTLGTNADARAALLLGQYDTPRVNVRLNATAYDVKGDFVVGDYIWVYDPGSGFYDNANEVVWEGETINPVKLRVIEMAVPIRQDWTVAFRRSNGTWIDLSQFYVPETGDVTVVVGDPPRSLSGIGSEPIGSRPTGDTSVPNVPAFTDFSVGAYQSGTTNTTKAAIRAAWTTPLNTDGSVILDGDHYEIRYRVDEVIGYQVRWAELEIYRWGDDPPYTWGAPLSEPVEDAPEWLTAFVGWGTNVFTLTELTPGVQYELQIRAVDAATPPHFGAWSTSSLVLASGDLFAPSAPAAPVVAASRLAVQVTHNLGRNSGGTFNLEQDLDHLEVHGGGSSDFLCTPGSKLGEMAATAGMLGAGIPAVGTFQIESTVGIHVKVVAVDRSGNKSDASPSAQATALLIDNSHISDLSVSKLTAGTITANSVLAAMIEVGTGGNIVLNEGAVIVKDLLGRTLIEMGKRTVDPLGGYGFTVFDPTTGLVNTRMGECADPIYRYGVEALNQQGKLVSLSGLAFGIVSQDLFVIETIPGTSYGNLATSSGPEATAYLGSGRAIVILTALLSVNETAGAAYMGFDVTDSNGVVQRNAQDGAALEIGKSGTAVAANMILDNRMSSLFLVDGLTPGYFRFTARYRKLSGAGGGSASANFPNVTVFPY